MKKFLAIFIAKQAAFWSRIFGRGGGGALPGLLALRINPEIVKELTENLDKGVILVTGTNGKTTTSKMIVEILGAGGLKVLSNSGGSNLARGIASELAMKSSIFGKIKEEIGVYEVDEATLPEVISYIKPRAIVITNIFRDQLDRYGEVDKTAAILKKAIDSTPESTLILNADDPIVASLGKDSVKVVYFGVHDEKLEAKSNLAIDIKDCLICGNELVYPHRYYGHIGLYICEKCGFSHPKTNITAKNVRLSPENTSATISTGRDSEDLTLPMTGLYSLYNALAAISTSNFMNIGSKTTLKALNKLTPAFGRMESFEMDGKKAVIHLVKNPTGFNQVLEAITQNRKNKTALIVLNDNFADGTDISWIWDVEFELFKTGFRRIVVSGIRKEDLRLRLKYADVTSQIIKTEKDLKSALNVAVSETNAGETLYILPTYTAMLDLRNDLVQRKILKNYWSK
jgi:UDP-N-acetylmuramyl tripeptide synthase